MPLDLDDPTAIAPAIFRALSARRIEAALSGGLGVRTVLALDRARFGGPAH
jgi:hypothetical protein